MTATTATVPIKGNIAEQYSGEAVTANNLNVDDAKYNAIPIVSSEPLTAKEEANTTPIISDQVDETSGDRYNFTNLQRASMQPGFQAAFDESIRKQVGTMVEFAKKDGQDSPVISLNNPDYSPFNLSPRKERFSVSDAPPVRAFRQSELLKGMYDIYAMPVKAGRTQSFSLEMVIIRKDTCTPLTGVELNDFFDKYSEPVAQEYAKKQQQALAS